MLELTNLKKNFKDTVVLKDISCVLPKGQIIGLLGKNGSGKSTLIKCIMGLLAYEGEINGLSFSQNQKKINRNFSFLLEPKFIGELSAFTNLKLLYQINNKNEEESIISALELVNLLEYRDRKVQDFSFGMLQRLGLAQAIMEEKELIILDEPTVGLDFDSTIAFNKLLKELVREKNMGIIFSTHEIDEVRNLCDIVLVLKDGYLTKVNTEEYLQKSYIFKLQSDTDSNKLYEQYNFFDVLNKNKLRCYENDLNKCMEFISKNDLNVNEIEVSDRLKDLF